MRRLTFINIVAALCVAVSLPAATLTFEEAIRRSLEVNNNIERSRAEIEVAEANRAFAHYRW